MGGIAADGGISVDQFLDNLKFLQTIPVFIAACHGSVGNDGCNCFGNSAAVIYLKPDGGF